MKNLLLILIVFLATACTKTESLTPINTVTFEMVGDLNGAVLIYKGYITTELNPTTPKITLKVPINERIYLRRFKGTPSLKTKVNGKEYLDVFFDNNGKYEFLIN